MTVREPVEYALGVALAKASATNGIIRTCERGWRAGQRANDRLTPKKFNRELEQLPMHTHSAICELIRVGMQHRNLAMQAAAQAAGIEQQNKALKIREQEVSLATMAAQRAESTAARAQVAEVQAPKEPEKLKIVQ